MIHGYAGWSDGMVLDERGVIFLWLFGFLAFPSSFVEKNGFAK